MSNITTVNNLVCSGNQTINGNIISNGNIQTTNITSTNINNSNSITSNVINATSGALTNTTVSNVLTLLSNTPITFNYNGNSYTISALMLFTLNQLAGANIASQAYVNTQIASLVNSSPDLLNTLSELAAAINNDASFSTTMTNLIATKVGLTSNNTISGSNIFSNLPYYVNTSDQLINKAYVDTRFTTLLSNNNTFSGSNTFSNDTTGNIINRLFTNILAINNNNTRRSVNDIFECCTSSTSNYLYYNNSSTFGFINTSNSASSWFINSSGAATIPSITTPSGAITTLTSTTGNIGTLNVSTASTFQNLPNFVNTNDKLINKAYVDDRFTTANIGTLNVSNTSTTSKLAIGSSMRAGTDIMKISLTNNGSYIYFNDSATLGAFNVNDSTFPWLINMSGLGSFRTVTTTTANITTDNVGTLNVSGTATINKVSINSTMRSNNDLFNCSTSSTGPYLFIANDATIGTYNTNNSTYPWFVEMDGDAKFESINCPITTTTSKLTVTNTKQNVSTSTSSGFELTTSSAQIIYLNSTNDSQFVTFAALGPDYNFNIYEFRSITTNVNSVMRFRGGPSFVQ